MAVLIEGISVIIRADRVEPPFPTWQDFVNWVPNQTLCCDKELARIGFMSPVDVHACIAELETKGLRYLMDGRAVDMAVVDQLRGLCCPCDWLEVGTIPLDNDDSKPVGAARLVGSANRVFMRPDGWVYEKSLTTDHKFVPTKDIERAFASATPPKNGLRTFTDHDGKQWFIGRTSSPDPGRKGND
jgi:hypothetical protein